MRVRCELGVARRDDLERIVDHGSCGARGSRGDLATRRGANRARCSCQSLPEKQTVCRGNKRFVMQY